MALLSQAPITQYLFVFVKSQAHSTEETNRHAIWDSIRYLSKRSSSISNLSWIRIAMIFSFVIIFSLLAACISCVAANCRGKRKKNALGKSNGVVSEMGDNKPAHTPTTSSADSSSDYDVEMLAQLDRVTANEIFQGREWDAYIREMKIKARRHARGVARTSQGIHLPTDCRTLEGKIRALPRSLIRSLTRSDPSITTGHPALDDVLQRLKTTTNETRSKEMAEMDVEE